MSDVAQPVSIRFGRSEIQATAGDLVDQSVQAIIYPANSRGIMGANRLGGGRLGAGGEVEREIMAQAPIEVGTAVVTTSGDLRGRGIEAIVHAVVVPQIGQTPELTTIRTSLRSALRLADERRFRSIAIPLIGVAADSSEAERLAVISALVDEVVAHERVSRTRLETIVLVSRFADDLPLIGRALASAQRRSRTELE